MKTGLKTTLGITMPKVGRLLLISGLQSQLTILLLVCVLSGFMLLMSLTTFFEISI